MRHLLLGALVASGLLAQAGGAQRVPGLRVTVALDLPGRSATQIDADVLAPLRARLEDVEGVDGVGSRCERGRGAAICRIPLRRSDPEFGEVLDRIRAASLAANLPRQPRLEVQGHPRCTIVVDADAPATALRDVALAVRAQLSRVAGVTGVHLHGYPAPSTTIELDAAALGAAGLTPDGVVATLREVDMQRTEPEDLARIVLDPRVRLGDVARIQVDATQPRQAAIRHGRHTGYVVVEALASDVDVLTGVRQALDAFPRDGWTLEVFVEPPTHVLEWRSSGTPRSLLLSVPALERCVAGIEPHQFFSKITASGRGRTEVWFDDGRPEQLAALSTATEGIPDLEVRPFEEGRSIELHVAATDHAVARAAARHLEVALDEIPGVRSALADLPPDERVTRVESDPERLAARGVTAESFALQVELLRSGIVLGQRDGEDVTIRLAHASPESTDALVVTGSGALVPLPELAEIRVDTEPASIQRWADGWYVEIRLDIGSADAPPDRVTIVRTCNEHLAGRFDAEVR